MLPEKEWTDQERWVWEKIKKGEDADFNSDTKFGGNLDPKDVRSWPESRILRPKFLKTILFGSPFSEVFKGKTLFIEHAWFKETINLSERELSCFIGLEFCHFEKPVNLRNAKTNFLFSFNGSVFKDRLDMDNFRVGDSLLLRGGAEFNEVVLDTAVIGSQLSMVGSKFNGTVQMNAIQIGRGLFMGRKAIFKEVNLISACIRGVLDMGDSTFTEKLRMDSMKVEGNFYMRGSNVSTSEPIDLFHLCVEGVLDISGSQLPSVNLTGAKIKGELIFGQQKLPPKWQENTSLNLTNAYVGALNDHPEGWPNKLNLNGFNYDHFGGVMGESENNMASRETPWLLSWLNKQELYTPQPYQQLAYIIEKGGQKQKANEVLYASKERERQENKSFKRKFWLFWQWLFVGYGFRFHHAFFWLLFFTALGALVLQVTGQGSLYSMPYGIFYSLDLFLPIIHLRELHYEIDWDGVVRYYFYVHQVMGYVLVSYLVAGLTGLKK